MKRRILALSGLSLACGLCAQAQYAIDWYAINGGGGTSTGALYVLSGTIGQADAGTMRGGPFTLQGGFWPGLIVPSSTEAPTLYIKGFGDSVDISWSPDTAGFELEVSPDLAGAGWTAAPAGNPVTIPATSTARFYRLRKPWSPFRPNVPGTRGGDFIFRAFSRYPSAPHLRLDRSVQEEQDTSDACHAEQREC